MATQTRQVWFKLSILAGNLTQLAGLALGWTLLWIAADTPSEVIAVIEMVSGWVLLYLGCHAIAHWFVGRLGGIRFRYYTVGGTNKSYPLVLQFVFNRMPFFGVQTERSSLHAAPKFHQALMWSAGVTSSVLVPLLASLWAVKLGLPYNRVLFFFTVFWSIATFMANFREGGDWDKVKSVYRAGRDVPNPGTRMIRKP